MKDLIKKYQGYFPAAFFVGGFLFDLLTTDRIDQGFSLVQQATYLFFIFLFMYWEVLTPKAFQKEKGFLKTMWGYHVEILHFLFGSLLSLYTIFYFKSSSLMTSFLFMGFLAAILIINEIPRFQSIGMRVRFAMLSMCLTSYFIYLVPVMTGEIGLVPFLIALSMSSAIFLLLYKQISRRHEDNDLMLKNVLVPGLVINMIFFGLYIFKVLPPVPISLKYVGIYHDIQKQNGHFVLNYERSWWRFWQSGAQTFIRRDGDKVYCFVSIFSPTDFRDQVKLVWMHKGRKGWKAWDAITLPIVGGRDQGYRGYANKGNFDKGDWQVRVMTSDEREVGRIYFTVTGAEAGTTREWRQDLF